MSDKHDESKQENSKDKKSAKKTTKKVDQEQKEKQEIFNEASKDAHHETLEKPQKRDEQSQKKLNKQPDDDWLYSQDNQGLNQQQIRGLEEYEKSKNQSSIKNPSNKKRQREKEFQSEIESAKGLKPTKKKHIQLDSSHQLQIQPQIIQQGVDMNQNNPRNQQNIMQPNQQNILQPNQGLLDQLRDFGTRFCFYASGWVSCQTAYGCSAVAACFRHHPSCEMLRQLDGMYGIFVLILIFFYGRWIYNFYRNARRSS